MIYYLTMFHDVTWSDFWVIPKIISATIYIQPNLWHKYSTFICPFESEKCGKEAKKNSSLDEIKKHFFIVFRGLAFDVKIKNNRHKL